MEFQLQLGMLQHDELSDALPMMRTRFYTSALCCALVVASLARLSIAYIFTSTCRIPTFRHML